MKTFINTLIIWTAFLMFYAVINMQIKLSDRINALELRVTAIEKRLADQPKIETLDLN